MTEMKEYLMRIDVVDEYVSIPTKLLFSLYDKKQAVIVYNQDNEGMYIVPFDYSYKDDLEYLISKFKWQKTEEIALTPLLFKFMDLFHHSWFNQLYNVLSSDYLYNVLVKIADVRNSETVIPEKEKVFVDFLSDFNLIKEFYNKRFDEKDDNFSTVFYIKDSYTYSKGFNHKKLWEPFVLEINKLLSTKLLQNGY